MILETIVVGPNQTNCYILGSSSTTDAVVIDPGADTALIKKALAKLAVTPKYIINTHGHADHIAASRDLKLPVYIHSLDADFLTSPYKNMSVFFGHWITSPRPQRLLSDGDKIDVGELALEIIHTPGHTPGGICIKCREQACLFPTIVFTGDTLFAGGVGRTDLVGSSEKDLFDSIKNKLLVLDDDTVIYPGHGPSSTIGRERVSNPYL